MAGVAVTVLPKFQEKTDFSAPPLEEIMFLIKKCWNGSVGCFDKYP